jgi:hypothetical protein
MILPEGGTGSWPAAALNVPAGTLEMNRKVQKDIFSHSEKELIHYIT